MEGQNQSEQFTQALRLDGRVYSPVTVAAEAGKIVSQASDLKRTSASRSCDDCGSETWQGRCENCEELDGWRKKWLNESGIPARHNAIDSWSQLGGTDEYMRKLDAFKRVVEGGTSVIAMIGGRGTGKTQCACVAVTETIRRKCNKPKELRRGKYTTMFKLLADLKGRYGKDSDGEAGWLTEWSKPHLLVIDELTERSDSDHAKYTLTSLVDERYANLKPTILVANVSYPDFSKLVGPSIASRATEGGGVILFDGWPSYRTA